MAEKGSNLRPPEPKSGVLPTELSANIAVAHVSGISRFREVARKRPAEGGPIPSNCWSVGGLTAALTLCSRALQHLLVLLLAHALATLLDQRSHEGCESSRSGCPPHPCDRSNLCRQHRPRGASVGGEHPIAGSSTGRTPDFESGGCGFEPRPANHPSCRCRSEGSPLAEAVAGSGRPVGWHVATSDGSSVGAVVRWRGLSSERAGSASSSGGRPLSLFGSE